MSSRPDFIIVANTSNLSEISCGAENFREKERLIDNIFDKKEIIHES